MVKVITVATNSKHYLPYLKESVKRNGGELVILGYNQEWTGFSLKYSLMINYLKQLDKNEIVCFVDGYDVICCRNLNELTNEFIKLKNQYNCKIVVGEDKLEMGYIKNNFFRLANEIKYGSCNSKYLNSGTYIGHANDVLKIISHIYKITNSNTSDDQVLMVKYCKKNSDDFYIDTESKIFLTVSNHFNEIDHLVKINNNNLYYKNSKPFFIHGPGSTYLDNILNKLGYDNDNGVIKKELQTDFYKKQVLYFSPTLHNDLMKTNYIYYILLFIILIILIILILFYTNNKYIKKLLKIKKRS